MRQSVRYLQFDAPKVNRCACSGRPGIGVVPWVNKGGWELGRTVWGGESPNLHRESTGVSRQQSATSACGHHIFCVFA